MRRRQSLAAEPPLVPRRFRPNAIPGVSNVNNNGLAMIVGGLVVVVAVFLYFGTNVFRGGGADRDINITVETPAPAPAPAQ